MSSATMRSQSAKTNKVSAHHQCCRFAAHAFFVAQIGRFLKKQAKQRGLSKLRDAADGFFQFSVIRNGNQILLVVHVLHREVFFGGEHLSEDFDEFHIFGRLVHRNATNLVFGFDFENQHCAGWCRTRCVLGVKCQTAKTKKK